MYNWIARKRFTYPREQDPAVGVEYIYMTEGSYITDELKHVRIIWGKAWKSISWLTRLEMFQSGGDDIARRLEKSEVMELSGYKEPLYCWSGDGFYAGFADTLLNVAKEEQNERKKIGYLRDAKEKLRGADLYRDLGEDYWLSESPIAKIIDKHLSDLEIARLDTDQGEPSFTHNTQHNNNQGLARLAAWPDDHAGISSTRQKLHQFLVDCQQLVVDKKLNNPKCFISYCWGPDNEKRQLLQKQLKELKFHLEVLGATVYLDVTNLGTDINMFMKEIQNCDFIFLIGTPELKIRLNKIESNNLKKEFAEIEKRLLSKQDCLLPLIFQAEGDFDSAREETMPTQLTKKHNVMVRDCRRSGDELAKSDALVTYIKTLSGDGIEPESSLGIIPIIYRMSDDKSGGTLYRYSRIVDSLTNGLIVSEYRQNDLPQTVTRPSKGSSLEFKSCNLL